MLSSLGSSYMTEIVLKSITALGDVTSLFSLDESKSQMDINGSKWLESVL